MKKTLLSLVFSILLFAIPTFAQKHGGGSPSHSNGGSHNGGGEHGGGPRGGGEQHGSPQVHGGPVRGGGEREHEQHGSPVVRGGEQHGQVRGPDRDRFDHDRYGHNFRHDDFGRAHFTRFGRGDGRWYGGHREYFFGGFWFYSYGWPGWFYNCNTYFDIGPDGFWYAYCYDNPGLYFRVYID
jgi:hypothetical protein